MSNALATRESNTQIQPTAQIDYGTLEKLVAQGDLKGLTPDQRVAYYQARCVACGLDPASQPFEYLTFQGKLILYAKKSATDQLTRLHSISLTITSRSLDTETGIYEVTCRAMFPGGRVGEDVGVLHVGNLRGEALAIALMKTVTKAKRRTVLAACGLGMLDESEVENEEVGDGAGFAPYSPAPDPPAIARHSPGKNNAHPNKSGFHNGQYASPEQTTKYLDRLKAKVQSVNEAWADFWQDPKTGEFPDVKACTTDLMTVYGADGHLVKWLVETDQIDPDALASVGKAANLGRHAAIVMYRGEADAAAMKAELEAYMVKAFEDKKMAIYRKHPDLAPDGFAEELAEASTKGDAYEGDTEGRE